VRSMSIYCVHKVETSQSSVDMENQLILDMENQLILKEHARF